MRWINGRIHADGWGEVAIFGQYALHPLNSSGYQVLVKFLPDLQFAAVDQLIGRGRPWRSIHNHAADEKLLLNYEIEVESAVGIRRNVGSDGAESPCGEKLLQAGMHACSVKKLSRLQRN